jgi:hypothetical protein
MRRNASDAFFLKASFSSPLNFTIAFAMAKTAAFLTMDLDVLIVTEQDVDPVDGFLS